MITTVLPPVHGPPQLHRSPGASFPPVPPHKSFRFGGPPSFLFPPPISPPPPINVLKRIVNQADEKSIWVQLLTVEDVYETKHGEGAFEHVVAVYWDRAEALKAPTVPQIHKSPGQSNSLVSAEFMAFDSFNHEARKGKLQPLTEFTRARERERRARERREQRAARAMEGRSTASRKHQGRAAAAERPRGRGTGRGESSLPRSAKKANKRGGVGTKADEEDESTSVPAPGKVINASQQRLASTIKNEFVGEKFRVLGIPIGVVPEPLRPSVGGEEPLSTVPEEKAVDPLQGQMIAEPTWQFPGAIPPWHGLEIIVEELEAMHKGEAWKVMRHLLRSLSVENIALRLSERPIPETYWKKPEKKRGSTTSSAGAPAGER